MAGSRPARILDPMPRVSRCGLAVLTTALLPACLDSPPSATIAAVDGSVQASESDAAVGCRTIVRNDFTNTDEWEPWWETGATVLLEKDRAHIIIDGPQVTGLWAEVASVPARPIDQTELDASFTLADGTNGTTGISLASEVDNDYYDLVVDDGELLAIYAPNGDASAEILCAPCPAYDPVAHARIRLRAAAGNVHFQAAPAAGEWNEIASAPIRGGAHAALAFAWSDPGELSELIVSEMAWRDCEM